jgi:hypothetical protein
MSDGDTIRLTMTGKLSYDGDITIVQAAQIVTYLHTGLAPISPVGPPASVDDLSGAAEPNRRQAGLSPREALASAGAKTNPEKIVAFALYVERQGDKDTFTLDDIRPLFRQARETAPSNLSRDLDAAIRSNWIAAASQKGEYYVTDVAADVLDSGFDSVGSGRNGGAKPKPKSTSARRPRRTVIPMPEAFKGIDITPSVDGYLNYHKVKTKTDKYLWAINAAKLWGVEALTNNEIIWLTDKLGVGLPSQDLGGYYRGNFKPGYVNRNAEGKLRVTPSGTQHLLNLGAGVGE